MIIFYCKHCERELRTTLENTGRVAICPCCQQKTRIPDVAVLLDDEPKYVQATRQAS